MSQEMRLIMAIVLSGVVLFGYHLLFPTPKPEMATTQATEQAQSTQAVASQAQPALGQNLPEQDNFSQPKVDVITEGETVAEPKDIVIETTQSKITLSTRGGLLTSYELKDYKREAKEDSPVKNLLTETKGSTALFLGFKGYSRLTKNKVFKVIEDKKINENVRAITLEWANNMLRMTKTFQFDLSKKDYAITVGYTLQNLSALDLTVKPYIENMIKQKPEPKEKGGILSYIAFDRPDMFSLYYLEDKNLTYDENWKKFSGERQSTGNIYWSAIADRYFMFAVIPDEKVAQTPSTRFARQDDSMVNQLFNGEVTLTPQQKIKGSYVAYIGPKIMSNLGAVSKNLERAVDYGWFSFLALPILWLMTFLRTFIPSWGVVIIVLTFIVKILLHPFNKKSMQSMKSMQQLQPKMQEIKKKYADDKEKQNQEVMQLFRTHKVNPMGGCLPMLLQFPVYIALYKVLWNAIELYHVPFMGIYADLSAPDPYYVSPVLLGVFMFLQQKLTPTASTDPMQQKMMMFMPVMFTVFMLFLPVGLVIYIFVNTFMSVIQQYMIKHDLTMKDILRGKFKPDPATV
ncbi:membrane protein insertase YidC [bacterium]|nr:membrane protein insertase YidC [bacterium]